MFQFSTMFSYSLCTNCYQIDAFRIESSLKTGEIVVTISVISNDQLHVGNANLIKNMTGSNDFLQFGLEYHFYSHISIHCKNTIFLELSKI